MYLDLLINNCIFTDTGLIIIYHFEDNVYYILRHDPNEKYDLNWDVASNIVPNRWSVGSYLDSEFVANTCGFKRLKHAVEMAKKYEPRQ